MLRDDVTDILGRIPAHDLGKTQVMLRSGYTFSIETVIRFEERYFIIRGREGGTTEEGRGFFIPYDEIVTLKIEKAVRVSEMNRMYGVDSGVDAEDKLALGAKKDEAKPATVTTPGPMTPAPPIDPAQIAKNNLLARIRAARTAAGVR
jgi:hypothetical protein